MRSAALLLLLVMLWSVGLLAFGDRVAQSTPPPDPPVSDGVVALTGASDARITAAMQLLETGKARRMLISGVNPAASRADIRNVAKAARRLYDCCVDLGFQAADTVGNARETAAWVRAKGYHSLIVVTSDFHMPRAMLELRAAMPGVTLTAYPVKSKEVDAERWWRTRGGARRMIVEYCKYLAILSRQTLVGLGPKGSSAPAVQPARAASSGPAT